MATLGGPYIDRSGLVFYYDTRNTNESFKGRPTTNYMGNGNFKNGDGIENENDSWGTYDIVALKNPGRSSYVLRQQTGEYEIHFKSGTSIQPNTTYCQSVWVAYTSDWNGSTQIQHSRYYNGSGTGYAIGGAGTLIETKVIDGLTWERRYATFTTQGTVNGSYSWYLGYSAGATTGYRYLADVQLEVGNYPSQFIDGTRYNNGSIIDITGGRTINASSVSFDSTDDLDFDGADDVMEIPTLTDIIDSDYTIEALIKRDVTGIQHGVLSDYQYAWWIFKITSGNKAYIRHKWNNSTNVIIEGSTNIGTGYTHVAVTFSKTSGMKLYVKGELDGSNSSTQPFILAGRGPRYIGHLREGAPGSPSSYFNGKIPSIRAYNRTLSAKEIKVNASMFKSLTG